MLGAFTLSSGNSVLPHLGWRNPDHLPARHLRRCSLSWALSLAPLRVSSSFTPVHGDDAMQLEYDPFRELLGLDVDPQAGNIVANTTKLRSWFGPNGQYIRESPCPSCRGRGYTPCPKCGIERSRSNCSECKGKGIKTCQQCFGERVIWEESVDERPWEKAQSSSPFKVKEDDEVDNLDIKVDIPRKSKRVYQSLSPEVSLKISRSLKSLNAKTGMFSKKMKILHQNPTLRAQRVAAIKKSKGTETARKQASETMKAFFSNPENRFKRSIAMKGVKFRCGHCGEEGHRQYYCPSLISETGKVTFRCRVCGKSGHNSRTCAKSSPDEESDNRNDSRRYRCKICAQPGHNRRTCQSECKTLNLNSVGLLVSKLDTKRTYYCNFCLKKGHNIRTCPDKKLPKV